MRCRPQDLYLKWCLIAVLALPTRSISGRCIITDSSSGQNLTLDASIGSLCCAVAQLHLANRPGGHCPEVTPALPLPFGVHCGKDENMEVSLPDKATAAAAHRLLCDLPGCWPAVLDVVNHAKKLSQAIDLPHPKCMVNASRPPSKEQDAKPHIPTAEMVAIVVSMMAVMLAGIALLHWVIAPRWLRSSAPAASPMTRRLEAASRFSATIAEVGEASLQLKLDAMATDTDQPASDSASLFVASQKSPTHGVAPDWHSSPSPPSLDPPSLKCVAPSGDEPSVTIPSPKPIGAIACSDFGIVGIDSEATKKSLEHDLEPEVLAHARLIEARSKCRAHITFLCVVGIGATVVRLVLSAIGAVGLAMAFIITLCVFQLGSLARTSIMPVVLPEVASRSEENTSPIQAWSRAGAYLLGDLRIYAGTTIICELVVVTVLASKAFSSADDSQEDDDNGLLVEHLGEGGMVSAPVLDFVLSQCALTLVLLRFYTAWLAHSLHKLRTELVNVVLPDSLKAPACEEKGSACEHQKDLDTLMPAWDLPSEAPQETPRSCRDWLRSSSIYWVCLGALLVLSAVAIGVWRAYVNQASVETSTCHTATVGLDFCVQKSYLGVFTTVGSHEECCRACDSKQGCQAWTFQKTTGQCWQMRFDTEPCKRWPSHSACRCHTSVDRVAGYIPGAEDMATS